MLTSLKAFFARFRFETREERIYRYLSEATDLVDLERREREIERQGYLW